MSEWHTIHLNARGPRHGFYRYRGSGESFEVEQLGVGRITDKGVVHTVEIIATFAEELRAQAAHRYGGAPMPEAA